MILGDIDSGINTAGFYLVVIARWFEDFLTLSEDIARTRKFGEFTDRAPACGKSGWQPLPRQLVGSGLFSARKSFIEIFRGQSTVFPTKRVTASDELEPSGHSAILGVRCREASALKPDKIAPAGFV